MSSEALKLFCPIKQILERIMTINLAPGYTQSNQKAIDWAHVRLMPLEESDVELLYVWQNASNIRDLTMGFRFPIQKETVKEWIKNQQEKNAKSRVVFAIRQEENLVGTIQLNNIDQYQRKAL